MDITITLLLQWIMAHLLFDFVFQTNAMVLDKKAKRWKSKWLYAHCLFHGFTIWLLCWKLSLWWIFSAVSVTHLLIDVWKMKQKDSLLFFVIDQTLHILVLVICFLIIKNNWQLFHAKAFSFWQNKSLWAVAIGYVCIGLPTAFILQYATKKWRQDLLDHDAPILKESLNDAGKWIGILERIIIFTCLLAGRYEGIGILIGAKSILRFNDLKGEHSQRQTEYVLIGTLLSFAIAIFTGIAVKWIM